MRDRPVFIDIDDGSAPAPAQPWQRRETYLPTYTNHLRNSLSSEMSFFFLELNGRRLQNEPWFCCHVPEPRGVRSAGPVGGAVERPIGTEKPVASIQAEGPVPGKRTGADSPPTDDCDRSRPREKPKRTPLLIVDSAPPPLWVAGSVHLTALIP